MEVFKTLPMDVVKYCLEFDNRFAVRNGRIMYRILRDDPRFSMLENKPIIECRKAGYNNNVYASYFDGKTLVNGRYKFSFTCIFHASNNTLSHYTRKIDAINECEVSIKGCNIE